MTDWHDLESSLGGILLQTSFDDRLKNNDYSATISTATETDTSTLTAGSGKDLYIYKASLNWRKASFSAAETYTLKLYVNGIVVETIIHYAANTTSANEYSFKTEFRKLTPAQIVKITFQGTNTDNKNVHANLTTIEVPTGENPTQYKGS